nr:aldolase/citrate lyase family protein [Cupriavidus basilensis]
MPSNAFKRAIAQHQTQIGLWLATADAYVAEMIAGTGYDWLLIDGEHAPNDLRATLAQLQAIGSAADSLPSGVTAPHPVVRLPVGDPVLVKQYMELGVQTLLVPMVDTPEQALEMARAMRYPPEGTRGMGSGLARSSRWLRYPNYIHEANEQACLLVQVESVEALRRIDAIAATPGVDGVFIGPADLSASMGLHGQAQHPDVVGAIRQGFERIHQAGKAAGILATVEGQAHQWIDAGASFVAVGVDISLLSKAAEALAARFPSRITPSAGAAGDY